MSASPCLLISESANHRDMTRRPGSKPPRPALVSRDADAMFAALAHETRRHIVYLLSHRGGELPSGYLAAQFAQSWPTTTRHLRVLEAANIVSVRQEGRSCMYRLEREHVQEMLSRWLALLDPPSPTQKWRSSGPQTLKEGRGR